MSGPVHDSRNVVVAYNPATRLPDAVRVWNGHIYKRCDNPGRIILEIDGHSYTILEWQVPHSTHHNLFPEKRGPLGLENYYRTLRVEGPVAKS